MEVGRPGAMGLVKRVMPTKSEEAQPEELKDIIDKVVFGQSNFHEWQEVRIWPPSASIGTAMTLLGRKNIELAEDMRVYKGRIVLMGNRTPSASGEFVLGAPDHLYGKPVDLCLAMTIMTTADLLRWELDAGDIGGAYLNAELRGPPIKFDATAQIVGFYPVAERPMCAAQEGFLWVAHVRARLVRDPR